MVSLDYQKWLCKLLGYDFDIEYKPRFTNCAADALSQVPAHPTLLSLSIPQVLQLDDLDEELDHDPTLSQIQIALSCKQPSKPGYSLIQDRLYYQNKLVLPASFALIPLVLHECNDNQLRDA